VAKLNTLSLTYLDEYAYLFLRI